MNSTDYTKKSYGRNAEIGDIFRHLEAGRDISMPGPRRLGKTFVLDRLVDAGPSRGWCAIKAEVAGCTDTNIFFREVSSKITDQLSKTNTTVGWFRQRIAQVINPRTTNSGTWYQQPLSLDHETNFDRLIKGLNDDTGCKWVLLIDELPIFLKALHDQGTQGIIAARNFMNQISRLRVNFPKVKWLITGSIGLEPLAQVGNYMGVLAKFENYNLATLSHEQARDYLIDLPVIEGLPNRKRITPAEADAIVCATGWRSAYYLEKVALKLDGTPTDDEENAGKLTEAAVNRLLQPIELSTFGVWEEHLRKHYTLTDRTAAIEVLGALAKNPQGLRANVLLSAVGNPKITSEVLGQLLVRLDADGFISVDQWAASDPMVTFRNVLLRRWWLRFPPSATS